MMFTSTLRNALRSSLVETGNRDAHSIQASDDRSGKRKKALESSSEIITEVIQEKKTLRSISRPPQVIKF